MNKNLLKLVSSLFVALVLLVSSSSFANDVEAPQEENSSENTNESTKTEESCSSKAFSFIAGADLEEPATTNQSSDSASSESSNTSSTEE